MVGVVRKIMGEASGTLVESKKPPLIEFHSPEAIKVPSSRWFFFLVCFFVLHTHRHTQTHMGQGEGLVLEQDVTRQVLLVSG